MESPYSDWYVFCGSGTYSVDMVRILWISYVFCGSAKYSVNLVRILWIWYVFCGSGCRVKIAGQRNVTSMSRELFQVVDTNIINDHH
jgi:hypothetical protein